MNQSKKQQKVFILHGYWNTSDHDGVKIVKVSNTVELPLKALDQIAESKAREYIEIHGYLQEDRGERHYEVKNGSNYAKFYITEEVLDYEE